MITAGLNLNRVREHHNHELKNKFSVTLLSLQQHDYLLIQKLLTSVSDGKMLKKTIIFIGYRHAINKYIKLTEESIFNLQTE